MRISDWSSDVCSSDLAPGLLDGGVEQVAAEPAADAVRHEPEVGEVDGAAGAARLVAPVQLEVAGRRSVHMKHEDLDAVVGEDAGELGICHMAPIQPAPRAADRVVQLAVESHSWP